MCKLVFNCTQISSFGKKSNMKTYFSKPLGVVCKVEPNDCRELRSCKCFFSNTRTSLHNVVARFPNHMNQVHAIHCEQGMTLASQGLDSLSPAFSVTISRRKLMGTEQMPWGN
jgi:hypothetical protein